MEWRRHEVLKPPSAEEMAKMTPPELVKLHEMYHEAITNSEKDPYRYGFIPDHWNKATEWFNKSSELLILGGNRCLRGDSLIYDPVTKESRRIDSIDKPFHVMAWDGEKVVIAEASPSFSKGLDRMLKIELSNGCSFVAAPEHRVLFSDKTWISCAALKLGDSLYLPESSLESSPLSHAQDVQRSFGKESNFQCDCHLSSRLCDEQLLAAEDNGLNAFPLQDDVPKCNLSFDNICRQTSPSVSNLIAGELDDQGNKFSHNHAEQLAFLQSSQDAFHPIAGQFSDKKYCASCKPCESILRLCEDQETLSVHRQSAVEFCPEELPDELNQRDNLSNYAMPYVVSITEEEIDVKWDITVPAYGNYIHAGIVHHNSAKTTYSAWLVVKCAMENPGSNIFCFSQNADASVRQQQCAVWYWLPMELKQKINSEQTSISYTRKNGFTKNALILPNGSQINFKTYTQFSNNDTILEGAELGSKYPNLINIGAWLDEYLIGEELIKTLRFRLADRNAKMLITFTPIDGYTDVVREYLAGAKTLEHRTAEVLKNERVPGVQKSVNRDAYIVYFHSKDNPFCGYERLVKDLQGRPREEILTRLYGIPVKSITTKFPCFSREVNVIKHEQIPRDNVTRYMVLDPAGRKNWFMIWIAVDEANCYYVYREWPDVNVGDWVKWHGNKWIGGEGSKGLGLGIKNYVDLICQLEEGETIFERLIDPRLGAALYQGKEGTSNIIMDLDNCGLTFIPAPGLEIDDGIQAIQNKMAYAKNRPIDGINRPHFYISERCENTIHCLQEYTGEGGNDEATKDPIDVLRYACVDKIAYVDSKSKFGLKRKSGY